MKNRIFLFMRVLLAGMGCLFLLCVHTILGPSSAITASLILLPGIWFLIRVLRPDEAASRHMASSDTSAEAEAPRIVALPRQSVRIRVATTAPRMPRGTPIVAHSGGHF